LPINDAGEATDGRAVRAKQLAHAPPAPALRGLPAAPSMGGGTARIRAKRLTTGPPAPRRARPAASLQPRPAPVVSPRELADSPPGLRVDDPLMALFGTLRLREVQPYPLLVLARRPADPRFEYLELLKRVMRDIYRVSTRHPPAIMYVGRRLTEYQLAMLRGGAGIYVVDADEVAESETGGAALARLTAGLEDRLREVYAQPPGVVILYGREATLSRLRRLWRPRLVAAHLYTRIPEPIEVSLPEDELVFRLVEAVYALPDGALGDAASVDEASVRAESMLLDCLRGHASDPLLGRLVRQAIDDEEARPDDAPLHYGLKAATVAHLLESGLHESSIETEVAISNTPVDVYARRGWSGGLVVEAETLASSLNPASRLAAVAASRLALGLSLWLVLHPLTASIYMPYVDAALGGHLRDGRAEAYVVDSGGCLLTAYQEHRSRLRGLAERLWERRRSGLA